MPLLKADYDFKQFQLKNAIMHKGTSFPGSPAEGQMFYRSDEDKLYLYDGAAWDAAIGDTFLNNSSGWYQITAKNTTGGALVEDDLLHIKGHDGTNFEVEKADATANKPAHLICPSGGMASNATATCTNRKTSAATKDFGASASTLGLAIYLSTTAGGWTLTAPTGADQLQQIVGRVKTLETTPASSNDGVIEFLIAANQTYKYGTSNLQDVSVTSAKLASGAVTAGKIAAGGISASDQFAAGVVDAAAIATDAVGSAEIVAGAVGSGELATGAVTAGKIAAGAIDAANLFAAGVVDAAAIGAGAVAASELATDAVTLVKVLKGASGGVFYNGAVGASSAGSGAYSGRHVSTVTHSLNTAKVSAQVTDISPVEDQLDIGFDLYVIDANSIRVVSDATIPTGTYELNVTAHG